MVIGVCTLELRVYGSGSLKEKRQVLQSVLDRVRNEFNVSTAEVEHQDSWQLSTLAFSCVGSDGGYVQGLLQRVVDFVDSRRFNVVLLDYQIELF